MDNESHTVSSISRRKFLGSSALMVGGVLASSSLLDACSSPSNKVASTTIKAKGLSQIEHVVIVMQENRSFDCYYGTLKGVNGFANAIKNDPSVLSQDFVANTSSAPIGKLMPFHFDTLNEPASCTTDIDHFWESQHGYWDNGKLDGFGSVHIIKDGPNAGRNAMGYYMRQDLPYYYSLADAYTICDAYHCSVLGPTHPNRVMSISGMLDPSGKFGGPVLTTRADVGYEGSVHWTTMPERLTSNGISWKFYEPRGAAYAPKTSLGAITSDNPLLYFSQILNSSGENNRNAFTPSWPDDFKSDVASGNLPQVSWINTPLPNQEHPPASSLGGEQVMNELLGYLFANPKVWAKTVVFITYDENGGFFDHVAPPVPEPGTQGEFLTGQLPATAKGIAGPIGLGFRVPMIVVSPFSKGGYVCSDTFDHTSTLRFLETRFGVEVPNLSDWRRSVTGDLTATLDLANPDYTVPSLPTPASTLPANEDPNLCSLNTVLGTEPTLPIPSPQVLPVQESGTKPRRGKQA